MFCFYTLKELKSSYFKFNFSRWRFSHFREHEYLDIFIIFPITRCYLVFFLAVYTKDFQFSILLCLLHTIKVIFKHDIVIVSIGQIALEFLISVTMWELFKTCMYRVKMLKRISAM